MRLPPGARVAIVGAGPSGLVAAKHALEAGFDVTVFEAGDDLGGQWHASAAHSGVWPGMHTDTSRAMTAFSDFAAPPDRGGGDAATRSTARGAHAGRYVASLQARLTRSSSRTTARTTSATPTSRPSPSNVCSKRLAGARADGGSCPQHVGARRSALGPRADPHAFAIDAT